MLKMDKNVIYQLFGIQTPVRRIPRKLKKHIKRTVCIALNFALRKEMEIEKYNAEVLASSSL